MTAIRQKIGRVGLKLRGPWTDNPQEPFMKMDVVEKDGNSYASKVDNNTSMPPSALWQLLAAKGKEGSAPVKSVNGKTGDVVLGAEDVGALPVGTPIPSVPSNVGAFYNDAGYVTNIVDDLVNYYLKNETYTRSEVQALLAAIQLFTYQVVAELPVASAETMRIIYLIPSSSPKAQNTKDEYITIDNGVGADTRYTWEQIGSTEVDVSGKADKVKNASSGHLAALDANGNLTDSGKGISDFLAKLSGTTGRLLVLGNGGQAQVSGYSPQSLLNAAESGAVSAITGRDGDELPTMTLYAIKGYIDSEVARLTALIGGAGSPGWRPFDSVHMVSGEKVLCDADGKIVLLDTGTTDLTYITYDPSTSSCGINQFDKASSDYASIEALGYGNQTYSATDDGSKIVFTLSDVEYTLDQVNWPWTITPEVSDWTEGSASQSVGCPPKWIEWDNAKLLVDSNGKVIVINDHGSINAVSTNKNGSVILIPSSDSYITNYANEYGTNIDVYGRTDTNNVLEFIFNYVTYKIDVNNGTITPSVEDWPKEKSNADLMWRSRSNGSPDEQYLVTNNGDVIEISISTQWETSTHTVRRTKSNGQISSGDTNIAQQEGWNSTTVQGTGTAGYISFEYNGVTYDVSTNGLGSITPDVTDIYS